jgi:hypothetical protein
LYHDFPATEAQTETAGRRARRLRAGAAAFSDPPSMSPAVIANAIAARIDAV